jgi:hypothetical protein
MPPATTLRSAWPVQQAKRSSSMIGSNPGARETAHLAMGSRSLIGLKTWKAEDARAMLDRERLCLAFEHLGQDLARKGVFLEIAVYGGSAIMLQFAWRRSTEDVDAVVRQGYDERSLAASVAHVAEQLGLSHDWLNNAVGMFTPLNESETLFEASGVYPGSGDPGLRVLLARPHYLLAMKLKALANLDRGDRDLSDARSLAAEIGITEHEDLRRLYVSIHDEEPRAAIALHFPAVLRSS